MSGLDIALRYAARWPVFPVSPQKKPYKGSHGFKDASQDPDQIKAWWQSHPEAMVGMPTGQTTGFLVVDLDVKPDRNGVAAWKRLKIDDASVPTSTTPSGGRHLYYRIGAHKVRNSASKIAPGVDVRADGGYIILPGSIRPDGKGYQLTNGRDIGDAPALPPEILAKIKDDPALAELGEACERVRKSKPGTRNDVLNKETFALAKLIAGRKLDAGDARRALSDAALDAGLTPHEISTTLDSAFTAAEQQSKDRKKKPPAKHLVDLPQFEPWPSPVDGVVLVAEITTALRRHVIMTEDQAHAVALWIVHAHCIGIARTSARLFITAPTKRCGKTRLLEVISEMVPKPLATSSITSSAMFRVIDAAQPTVLLDEIEIVFGSPDRALANDLRGLLDNGYSARQRYHRSSGDDHIVTPFKVFAATVIAGIGMKVPDSVLDRSIIIKLKRKLPSEMVDRFEEDRIEHLTICGRKACRWAADNIERLKHLRPDPPESLNDRARDNWRPLLSIAEACSPEWLDAALTAAAALSDDNEGDADIDFSLAALRDCQAIYQRVAGLKQSTEISSVDLLAHLIAMPERPWGDLMRGRPITANKLARLLAGYGIGPGMIGPKDSRERGYRWRSFNDAWERYTA